MTVKTMMSEAILGKRVNAAREWRLHVHLTHKAGEAYLPPTPPPTPS
jgi:hypothetical protein